MTSALEPLCHGAGLPDDALAHLTLVGVDPVLRSSFAVGSAAQASLAAAALAATRIGAHRNGLRQQVRVDMRHAALKCTGRFEIDGRTPEFWDRLAGLYGCGDGRWLRLLGLPPRADTRRAAVAVAAALRGWPAALRRPSWLRCAQAS